VRFRHGFGASDILLPHEESFTIMAQKKPKEIVVVGSKVRDVIRQAGLRSDGELVQAISDKVHEVLDAAVARCKDNKRGTVRPVDL